MQAGGRGGGRGRGSWRPRYRGYGRGKGSDRASDNNSLNNSILRQPSTSQGSVRTPSHQVPITVHLSGTDAVWKLYFPNDAHTAEASQRIDCFKSYVHKHRGSFDLEKIEQTRSAPLDLQDLSHDEDFTAGWPKFRDELFNNPEYTLSLLEFCLHEELKCEDKIRVRILNHEPVVPLSSLKVDYFGKLVTIKGTVIRVGSVGLICTSAAFQCSGCGAVQAVVQPQGVFTAPTFCHTCRNCSKLDPLQTSPFTITEDWQTAKIQEIHSQSVSGSIPRSVEIELHGDLVGSACPGDVLSVTGVVQVRGESRGGEDGRRAARLLQLYVQAVSVHSQRNLSSPALSFTLTDYYAIQEIHGSEDVFRLLVHSLCPSIFGHEAVKAGLVLGLLGGTTGPAQQAGVRCDPHVLVVGDPGLGKSRLLQAAARAAPRGVYVCGASASAGGLTVALGREAGGDFALEAGALVLADRGVCCVDELDKMSAHHSSLLEAMEQGRVSVAKGGVVCSLAARATVLAAANPAAGSYDRAKTVAENLKINSALLSRFDLVFILLDKPDEKIDSMLSEHVLALHSGNKTKNNSANTSVVDLNSQHNKEMSLSARLRLKPGEVIDTLPLVLLRKYIAYARRYVHPKLSVEAAKALQSFYLELRKSYQDGQHDGTPITTRQLEACVRLTQARAKVELREEATAQDAADVISLVKHSLSDTFSDEFGNIQLSRSINGSGVSSRSALKRFLDVLTRVAKQLGKDVFSRQELFRLHREAGVPGDAAALVESMHVHSYLLLKGSDTYQLLAL